MSARQPAGAAGRDAAPGGDVTASRQAAYAIEALVARILVAGTYLAIGLILIGVLGLVASGTDPLAHGAIPPFDLPAIPAELAGLQPVGLIWAGIVIVMALPILRVVVAGAGFFAAGERRLALVSALVVLVVALSIVAAAQIAV